ncbi:MAG TPA: c-type cytochrome domain-containing protein [Verrucomicrobiae bacterium]|jgi:hypothetical protein|nr:c-type cytochrome domain-containing protein [Verrucomicrobiae bacterium]
MKPFIQKSTHPIIQPFAFVLVLVFALAPRCVQASDDPPKALPPPANINVVFDRDIHPILENSCLRCHVSPKPKSNFRLDSREYALAGGDNNTNDIVPGKSRDSLLIAYAAGQVPDMKMPPPGRGDSLTPQQIGLLRAWIDQGASWTTTNRPPPPDLILQPVIGGFAVHGNQSKFREIQGTRQGVSGGVDSFLFEQTTPDEKISFSGRAIVPDNDFDFRFLLQEAGGGFIRAGFDQWRKYYATDGGYDPLVPPRGFNFNRDLYVDNGRAWADFGVDLPHGTELVLGYEYDYRKGNEATLDWGRASGKDFYPSTQLLDERTHVLKFNLTKTFYDWRLENNARLELYSQNDQSSESYVTGPRAAPLESFRPGDRYHQAQGMNTLTLEKQLWDWWYIDGGFFYSKLRGGDFFNETQVLPASTKQLSSQEITLSRESAIFSVANLFTPIHFLTISLGTQNEWTRETGFGLSIPDIQLGGTNVPANSSLSEFKASQNANFRYLRIPYTVVSGDAQFSENNYGIEQYENAVDLQRHTAANNFRYDLKTGFSTSPWQTTDLTVQFERQSSLTAYNQLEDVWLGVPPPTNGYPAFILDRNITSDQFETKLVLRPLTWLKTTVTYQLTETDYSSKTDPFQTLTAIAPGGVIVDGHCDSQTYGISAMATPWRPLYFLGAFTYSHSRLETANNGDPAVTPYGGNIFTVNAAATWLINPKASLQLSYYFSTANYAQNNAAATVPAGLNYQRHDVIAGLTRQLTKNLSGTLRYEFSQYTEPSSGNANNFTANGIFAILTYRWP